MATLTISMPDETGVKLTDVLGWTEDLGISRMTFVKEHIINQLRSQYRSAKHQALLHEVYQQNFELDGLDK